MEKLKGFWGYLEIRENKVLGELGMGEDAPFKLNQLALDSLAKTAAFP